MRSHAEQLELFQNIVKEAVDEAFPPIIQAKTYPPRLREMERYSIIGGKCLRGALALAFCLGSGGDPRNARDFAVAIETLHAYSLIHDDMPCMDNDELRRGKPTVHVKFGEWQALLTGDLLQAEAFRIAAHSTSAKGASHKALSVLAQAASDICMGQYLDLTGSDDLETVIMKKTGALFSAACSIGCCASQSVKPENISAAQLYGMSIGCAFQHKDDIADAHEDDHTPSFFKHFGEHKTWARIHHYAKEAKAAVHIGKFTNAEFLEWFIDYIVEL